MLRYDYASGLNSSISRLSSLSDRAGVLEGYEYLGLSGVVVRSHPQPDVDLSYVKRSGESDGAAGDKYTGLDQFGRVIDQRWLDPISGAATDRFQYGYDLLGNRLYRDNVVNAAFGELYGYDAMSQLVSFDRGTLNGTKTGLTGAASRAQDWDYDAVGNFDSVTTNGTAQTRTANRQNEITSIGGATTPTYDVNGNMTGDETGKQFVYDAWNRLVEVKNSGGATLKTYDYDGMNRRVKEQATGTRAVHLYYSADWQVLAEKVGSNTTNRYVWSPVYVDALVLRDRDTNADGTLDERLWVQQDANFNVTALVNGSGTVVERYVYDAFGAVTVLDGSFGSRGTSSYGWTQGFQGMFFDATSGLNVSRGRPGYSPTLGRWVQNDPIQFYGEDVNLYRFVGNRPSISTDPTGFAALSKKVDEGTIEWESKVAADDKANFTITFTPDPKKCACKNITFVQVVLENTTGGVRRYPLSEDYYKKFETDSGARLDHLKGETDPYYGALWDEKDKKWISEPGGAPGNGPNGKAASMEDNAGTGDARSGKGVKIKRFEVMVVCIDTKKILGGVKWGFEVQDDIHSKIKLTGGGANDFSEKPSKEWQAAVDKWNQVAKTEGWEQFK